MAVDCLAACISRKVMYLENHVVVTSCQSEIAKALLNQESLVKQTFGEKKICKAKALRDFAHK